MTNASASAASFLVAETPFPPDSLAAFLDLCEGRWMSLRSTFALDESDDWHNSERGEVAMTHTSLEADQHQLNVADAAGQSLATLVFNADGSLQRNEGAATPAGLWQLRDDGSLELQFPAADGAVVQERIWFTKPNLRLRSTTLMDGEGTPQQASFCSEIRRVTAPTS